MDVPHPEGNGSRLLAIGCVLFVAEVYDHPDSQRGQMFQATLAWLSPAVQPGAHLAKVGARRLGGHGRRRHPDSSCQADDPDREPAHR